MRRFLVAALLSACALGTSAQTEVVTRSQAQRLDCLVKPANPPRYPLRETPDHGEGAMRVLLKFSKPDTEPAFEVLFNSAREDMQDQVFDYVSRLRLPCLLPEDGVVTAVQDFSFKNHDRDPTPMPTDSAIGDQPPLCVVMPRHELDYIQRTSQPETENLVAQITFTGDGQQPPEVKFIYAKASSRFERAVRRWVSEYRMPCRTAQDKPRTVEQWFSMFPRNFHYGLKQDRFSLAEFIARTREPKKLKAHFELKTMGCPFSLTFVLGGGGYANRTYMPGPTDPNKVGLRRWLETLQFDFASEAMAEDLFGSHIQIDVPCETLDLQGESVASGG
jgi:hypothetical protein